MKQIKISLRKASIRLAIATSALSGLVAATVSTTAQASIDVASAHVGEVSLVLGKAWINRPGGERERVQVGTVIQASDSIETATNGHVHIRFVDQALVSVRPSSTLEVVRYDYDPQSPASSAIKLNLVEGVARSISGEAARQARQNFRMNTPIAAIGVRGTDFVVRADQRSVRALVNEGAIFVAPFSSQCLADTFGPCSDNGLELAGGLDQIVQISANGGAVLLPLSPTGVPQDAFGASINGQALALTNAEDDTDEAESSELYAETITARAVNPRIARSLAARPPAPPEFTPDIAVAPPLLASNQLVWGRWTEGNLANERITVSYAEASAGTREGTVGNNMYALFRNEEGTKLVDRGLGELSFGLNQAQANYRSDAGSSLMDVTGGALNLDFNTRRFSTSLDLNHAATGPINISDSGTLSASGMFNNRTDTQVTAGAISIDGKEAGYFFQKILQTGSVDGLTLWNLQP